MSKLLWFAVAAGYWWGIGAADTVALPSTQGAFPSGSMWEQLVSEAEHLHLPTKFLKEMPGDYIRFEFGDLRTYAAEYHPEEHRMVLNRSLSFNAAGGVLKPLRAMAHKELEVLYHELFHAYMDFLSSAGEKSELMRFARKQQRCRYGEVAIVPLAQRQHETEARYLTESESWEALNETWAVFIGWAIWNQLEIQGNGTVSMVQREDQFDRWHRRLKSAYVNGEFRGYYAPEDQDERRMTHKRFLAKQSQLTWREATVLMRQVLGFSEEIIHRLSKSPEFSQVDRTSPSC